MIETKEFPAAVVVTAATGRLLCDMGQVYEILNFLTNDNLFTHQLPRAFRECKPWLMHRHAECRLAAESESALDKLLESATNPKDACVEWVKSLGLPETITIERIPMDDHTRRCPIEDAIGMVGKDRVVIVPPESQ